MRESTQLLRQRDFEKADQVMACPETKVAPGQAGRSALVAAAKDC